MPLEYPVRTTRLLMIPGNCAAVPASKTDREGLSGILPACQPNSTWTVMNSSGQIIAGSGIDSASGVSMMKMTWAT